MNPKFETKAFILWRDCQVHGWERTSEEISETSELSVVDVRTVIRIKRWGNRIRKKPGSVITESTHGIVRTPYLISQDALHDLLGA